MCRFFCVVIVFVFCSTEAIAQPYTGFKTAKPDSIPLLVSLEPDCPVATRPVRKTVERVLRRVGVNPTDWSSPLQREVGWFGAKITLECRPDDSRIDFRVSFRDSTGFQLRGAHGTDHGASLGYSPSPPNWDMEATVNSIVDKIVSEFLQKNYDL